MRALCCLRVYVRTGFAFTFLLSILLSLPIKAASQNHATYKTLAQHVLLISLVDPSVKWQDFLSILQGASEAEKLEYIDTIQVDIAEFWHQRQVALPYDSLDVSASSKRKTFALEPNVEDYLSVLNHIRRLMWLNERHDWASIQPGGLLRPGDSHKTVSAISQRLWLLGDLSSRSETQFVFDDTIADAVARFQARHGLKADAVIGPKTLYWLNQTPKERAELLADNFVQKTSYKADLGEQYLLVNIPAFEMVLVSDNQVALTSRVIVGRSYRRTPVMKGQISNIVINPTWTVPKKLMRRDILPKVAENGSYISDRQFDVYDVSGTKVSKTPQEWQDIVNAGPFPYRLVQRPGEINALGRYKFHFKNDLNIYLHDTPDKGLFAEDDRALSSGCVRIEKVQELAEWFATNVVIDKRTWQRMQTEGGNTQWFSLSQTVPIHFVYWNAWVDATNLAQYRNDIYHLNNMGQTIVANNSSTSLQGVAR
ncbi:murein L,D-transpeptidase [Shewanella sp. KT0246]|uniref:L,D-transpeptidase family protein n=1 Tax=Shewanella sp. KT0246 TaxID=2815912 RepID=UPI001BC522FD|nr:L,D-transpeptidase family protein [Shewanella sp. KT0246]GIU54172.1 peptidoglycan-binding protein [Shewanella sp. KT0246]